MDEMMTQKEQAEGVFESIGSGVCKDTDDARKGMMNEHRGRACDAEPMMTCTRCGEYLPRSKLERMRTGTYRRVCNHCKWLYYVKPSRYRRILRELEERRARKGE